MKIRITFDYEIPRDLQELTRQSDTTPIELAENLFLKELRESEKFTGEFSLEHAEIIA